MQREQRSKVGQGEMIGIYLLDEAQHACDSVIGGYGQTAICGGIGEDFAVCRWPIAVKVKKKITRQRLVQHLRDLANIIEGSGFFLKVSEEDRLDHKGEPFGRSFYSVEHDGLE